MMTPNRFFTIKTTKETLLFRADAFETKQRLETLEIIVSASALYRLKKGENLKRISGKADKITIECVS